MPKTIRNVFHPVRLCLAGIALLCACDGARPTGPAETTERARPEILIYCGITMVQPVMELAEIVEREKKCTIRLTYGESQRLKETALLAQTGDIFFPGSPGYLTSMIADKTIVETAEIGENRIAFMVAKGNPKRIRPDLRELLRSDLRIVMGDPEAGSIGKETKIALEQLKIFDRAVDRALYLTPDSKGLIQAIRSGDADIVVSWRALAMQKENAGFLDVVPLPDSQTRGRALTMGRLRFSREEETAHYFLKRAISEEGRAIFRKNGF